MSIAMGSLDRAVEMLNRVARTHSPRQPQRFEKPKQRYEPPKKKDGFSLESMLDERSLNNLQKAVRK